MSFECRPEGPWQLLAVVYAYNKSRGLNTEYTSAHGHLRWCEDVVLEIPHRCSSHTVPSCTTPHHQTTCERTTAGAKKMRRKWLFNYRLFLRYVYR